MRLRLEVFSETVVLEVSQQMTIRSIAVLLAGLKTRVQPHIKWIFINALHAEIIPETIHAIARLKIHRDQNKNESLKKIVFISSIAQIADFGSLDAALLNCPSQDGTLYLEKVRLESEKNQLSQKKENLEKDLESPKNQKHGSALSPIHQNAYLLRLQEVLKTEIKKASLRLGKLKGLKPNPEDVKSIEDREKKILAELKIKGLLPSSGGQ